MEAAGPGRLRARRHTRRPGSSGRWSPVWPGLQELSSRISPPLRCTGWRSHPSEPHVTIPRKASGAAASAAAPAGGLVPGEGDKEPPSLHDTGPDGDRLRRAPRPRGAVRSGRQRVVPEAHAAEPVDPGGRGGVAVGAEGSACRARAVARGARGVAVRGAAREPAGGEAAAAVEGVGISAGAAAGRGVRQGRAAHREGGPRHRRMEGVLEYDSDEHHGPRCWIADDERLDRVEAETGWRMVPVDRFDLRPSNNPTPEIRPSRGRRRAA